MAVGLFQLVDSGLLASQNSEIQPVNDSMVGVLVLDSHGIPDPNIEQTYADIVADEVQDADYVSIAGNGLLLLMLIAEISEAVVQVTMKTANFGTTSTIAARYFYILKRSGGTLSPSDKILGFMDLNDGGVGNIESVNDEFSVTANPIGGLYQVTLNLLPAPSVDFNTYLEGYTDNNKHKAYVSDLDLITQNSTFQIDASGVTNGPSDFTTDTGYITTYIHPTLVDHVQIIWGAKGANENKIWIRNNDTGTWSTWVLIADGGSFTERLVGYKDDGRHKNYAGDLNDILVNSQYSFAPANVTNEPSDMLPTDFSFLKTMYETANTLSGSQVIFGMLGSSQYKIWMRHKINDVWNAWKLVVDGGAFTQRLDGFLDTGLHEVTDNMDADLLQSNSEFYFITTTAINIPVDMNGASNAFICTMAGNNANLTTQVIYGMQSTDQGKQWMRHQVGNVWTAWVKVVDGGAFTQRLAGYEDTGLHAEFQNDADDVLTNSAYHVNGDLTAGLPTEFAAMTGILSTLMWSVDENRGTQILISNIGGEKHWQRNRTVGVWGAWKLVVDGGAFTQRLAGYEDTGIHVTYAGDLDDINQNSKYLIWTGSSTNGPSDFDSIGWLETMMKDAPNLDSLQVLYGHTTLDEYKIWIRQETAGSWGAWKLVVDGGAFTQRLVGYSDIGLHENSPLDLNTILWNSKYVTSNGALVNAPDDLNIGSRGFIETTVNTGTNGSQVLYGRSGANANKIWMREYAASVWGAWTLVVSDQAKKVFYGRVDGTTAAISQTNGGVTAVRSSAGVYLCTFDVAELNANYNVQVTPREVSFRNGWCSSNLSATFTIRGAIASGAETDSDLMYLITRNA